MVHTTGRTWEESFDVLLQYKKQHGNCLVPTNYESDTTFARWVRRQRCYRTKLTKQQVQKLNSIGFCWDANQFDKRWQEKFNRLKLYKLSHGDCNVPKGYENDRALANWVKEQRKNCNKGLLSKRRFKSLEKLGFAWRLQAFNVRDTSAEDKKWLLQYHKLCKFKERYGHCVVPYNYEDDQALTSWVRGQRRNFVKNFIRQDRKEMLDNIGFCWRISSDAERKASKDILEKIRSSSVPRTDASSHPELGTRIRKKLDNGCFDGVVTRKGPEDTWHVECMDGDEEDMSDEELDTHSALYEEYYTKASIGAFSDEDAMSSTFNDEKLHLGTKLRKEFDFGWLDGVVTGKGEKDCWHIRYTDDSEECISEEELQDLVAAYEEHYTISDTSDADKEEEEDTGLSERNSAEESPLPDICASTDSNPASALDPSLAAEAAGTSPNTEESKAMVKMEDNKENGTARRKTAKSAEDNFKRKRPPISENSTSAASGQAKRSAPSSCKKESNDSEEGTPQSPTEDCQGTNAEMTEPTQDKLLSSKRLLALSTSRQSLKSVPGVVTEVPKEGTMTNIPRKRPSTASPEPTSNVPTATEGSSNSSEGEKGEESLTNTTANEATDDAYARLTPLFFQLCQTINASSKGRKRLPKYEKVFERWISKEREKMECPGADNGHPNKRRKLP